MLSPLATALVLGLAALGPVVHGKIQLQSTWSQNSDDNGRVIASGIAVSAAHNMVYTVGYTYGVIGGHTVISNSYDGMLRGFFYNENTSLPIADRLESRFDYFIGLPGQTGFYYRKVTTDEHGTAYACGFATHPVEAPVTGSHDLVITALYRDGSLKWQQQYTTNELDAHSETRACPIVYKAGFLHTWIQHATNSPVVAKIRARDGELVWTSRPVIPTSGVVRAYDYSTDSLGVDGNLNIYFTAVFDGNIPAGHGDQGRTNRGGWDWLAVKLDKDGQVMWRTFVGTSSSDRSRTLDCNDQGVLVVGGEAFAGFGGAPLEGSASDAFVSRLDIETGALMWTRIWNDHEASYYYDEHTFSTSVSPTGNIYAIYRIRNNARTTYLREFDPTGSLKRDFGLPAAGTSVVPYGSVVDSASRLWIVAVYKGSLNTHPTVSNDASFVILGEDEDEFATTPNCSDWSETLASIESVLGISQS